MRIPTLACLIAVAFVVCVDVHAYSHNNAPLRKHGQKSAGSHHPPEPQNPRGHGRGNERSSQIDQELEGHCDPRVDLSCFRCQHPKFAGEGVSSSRVRNGDRDCEDGSDEKDRACTADSNDCFECSDGSRKIKDEFKCDNIEDCYDGSDEEYCYYPTGDLYTCYSTGEKVDMAYTCDNYDDCSDGSDEYCFRSSTGEMGYCDDDCEYDVLYEQVCDGEVDSYNGMDEMNCFQCADGLYKIWEEYLFDDYEDCQDGSDERPSGGPEIIAPVNPVLEEPDVVESCQWQEWGAFSACSNDCGAGTRSKTRRCVCQTTSCTSKADETQTEKCRGSSCPTEAISGCGTRSLSVAQGRIVGGEDAEVGAWPWQAQLLYRGSFKCGGTLYKNKYVISAAHCFDGKDQASSWSVRLGNRYTYRNPSGSQIHESNVESILRSPNQPYNSRTFDNDIVVLELTTPVTNPTGTISNVCVDTDADKTFDSSSNCYISGFGLTEDNGNVASKLQAAAVPYISAQSCVEYYGFGITNNMLCAGFPALGGVDSCQGDSGGPLVCTAPDDPSNPQSPHRWYLVGITSWGYGCAQVGIPGVYADVSRFGDWIKGLS
ncbi:atrial natriuretic peptide-converting enzyme-like [Patiria miniata]|uniref:Peptidase S1 domain-containing protein n=1 Tax=Patiria miniata TaxID=46514 RepID=A0A914A5U7_PATMI|nr:atrial natriuretic peptide-converting enzyme-like [Patiria miniata]